MTDLMSSVEQNGATENEIATNAVENVPVEHKDNGEDTPFIVKAPRINSKLILQNMEEVLNSVKKKHRQKHKRLKEQKKMAQIEAASAATTNTQEIDESCTTTANKSENAEQTTSSKHKNPLQEKAALGNDVNQKKTKNKSCISPTKAITKTNGSILKHFQRTPKKESSTLTDNITPNSVKANAFEVMMNARNKAMGHNTPGKELNLSPVAVDEKTTVNVKRKLMLEEWAELKGGAKRKLDEEARAAYVDQQLEQRAKRFKQMLVHGNSRKSAEKKSTMTAVQPKLSEEKPRKRNSRHNEGSSEVTPKLKTPTKKTECLLGYFQKKDSAEQIDEKATNGRPKRRQRRAQVKVEKVTEAIATIEQSCATPTTHEVQNSPNVRPRRSCARKARYDYDLEQSPTKADPHNDSATIEILASDVSNDVIDADTIATPTRKPGKQSKQLAPLFIRTMPKPVPDAEVLKARQAFLRSGVPEKLRQEQAKQKQFEQNYQDALELFPKISHIAQQTAEEAQHLAHLHQRKLKFKLNTLSDALDVETSSPPARASKRKSKGKADVIGKFTNCSIHDFKPKAQLNGYSLHIPLPTLENKRNIIKSWKTIFEQFPTYKCYNQMRLKYRYFSAIDSAQDTEQVSESLVVTRQSRRSLEAQQKLSMDAADDVKPPAMAPNGELLFTEKYKPLMMEQILVNLGPVTQLKEFLASWSNVHNPPTTRTGDSVDFSYDSANDSNSSYAATSNSVVLLGPASSGKTNAVYALANELNFNVLEINAGMRRTGKKLIQELQEATQSHQIRKDSKTQKQLLKMSFQTKRTPSQDSAAGGYTEQTNARKCIILIEDADIVFEQLDAGFVDAIYTLSASSKRPVILIASNPNCAHLQRLMQQNTIEFHVPNVLSISKFLSVLSLIENCPIQLDDLISLHLFNHNDLRKTLLELQFFIQSGGDRDAGQQTAKPAAAPNEHDEQKYFASTSVELCADEADMQANSDEHLQRHKQSTKSKAQKSNNNNNNNNNNEDAVYMHRTLFEFFTLNQNEKWRIPFPVDFNLLHINLNDIMNASVVKRPLATAHAPNTVTTRSGNKHTSRSPKKEWLNTATGATSKRTHLDTLCDFYENISIGSLINEKHQDDERDRLKTDMSEYIAHNLVEQSLITNLKTDLFPYNLFNTTKSCASMCSQVAPMGLRTRRAKALDVEPILRDICRSEKLRVNTERRSTRFYHYLRNFSASSGFSLEQFDNVCSILQNEQQHNDDGVQE